MVNSYYFLNQCFKCVYARYLLQFSKGKDRKEKSQVKIIPILMCIIILSIIKMY